MPAATVQTDPRFIICDPLREEYVAPFPSVLSMTDSLATAAQFDSEAAAVVRGRQLIGPDRPWLTFLTDGGKRSSCTSSNRGR